MNKIENMLGKVFTTVEQNGNDELVFKNNEEVFTFYHSQDCCESVTIEDIVGDLRDLIGVPLLMAEKVTSKENPINYTPNEYQDSFTWTFYKFATIKGYVDVRWYGESNGYYSEEVDLEHMVLK